MGEHGRPSSHRIVAFKLLDLDANLGSKPKPYNPCLNKNHPRNVQEISKHIHEVLNSQNKY